MSLTICESSSSILPWVSSVKSSFARVISTVGVYFIGLNSLICFDDFWAIRLGKVSNFYSLIIGGKITEFEQSSGEISNKGMWDKITDFWSFENSATIKFWLFDFMSKIWLEPFIIISWI